MRKNLQPVTLAAVRAECRRRWRVTTGREWDEKKDARLFQVLPEFDPPEERRRVRAARRRGELALDVLARAARRLRATREALVEGLATEEELTDCKIDMIDELLAGLPDALLEQPPPWRADRSEVARSRFVRRVLDAHDIAHFARSPALLACVLVLGGHRPVINAADTLQSVLRREADSVRKAVAYYRRPARKRR